MIDHPAVSCFSKKDAFQNESRVRKHRILKISLPEQVRLEMNVNVFDKRKHSRDEIDVVTFPHFVFVQKCRRPCRIVGKEPILGTSALR